MRDTSSTFDDTSTSSDGTSDANTDSSENTTKNIDSYGEISAYYDRADIPKKKSAGFGRFKPDMPIGTFVIKDKQKNPSEAGIILNNRIGKPDGSGVRVGGELKENKNFQARALELAKLTELGRAATTAGFELYTNAKGEPVFKIPQEYQDSIATRATDNLTNTIKKSTLERFNLLASHIAQLAALEARGNKTGVNTKKYTTTIDRLIEGAKKEEGEGEFNDTLNVIEANLADLEEIVSAKEKEKKDKEVLERLTQEELVKNLEDTKKERDEANNAAKAAQEKADSQIEEAKKQAELQRKKEEAAIASQKETIKRERENILALVRSYSVALGHFLKTELLGEGLTTSLNDRTAEDALIASAQELNTIKSSFIENPSQETLDTFKKKSDTYAALIATLIQEHPVKEQVHHDEKPEASPKFFGIDMGWPSEAIKQEKKEGESTPRWILVGKDGSTTELSNSALWSSLAAKFDDVFTQYQDFFDGPERLQKIQNYNNLITSKNEIIAALLNLDIDKLSTEDDQDLLVRFKESIKSAEDSWNTILKEREAVKQKKIEQEKLLDRLTSYNARLVEITNLQNSLLPYTGTQDQQDALVLAKDSVIAKQQAAKNLVEAKESLTEDLMNEYRDGLDVISGLLTALKKDKDIFDAAQKIEQDRLVSLFKETEPTFIRINDQVDAIISDIASPTELAMVTGRFDIIIKERKNLTETIDEKQQPITEEMIKLYAKHLQDFDKGMLSGVQNRLRTLHQVSVDAPTSTQKTRVLLPNGRLAEEADTKSSNPTLQMLKGLEDREENPLKEEYTKWARRDFSGFIRWYMKEVKAWNDDDKNKLAAEPIVNAHIKNLETRKDELETRKEESFKSARENESSSNNRSLLAKQLEALNGEIDELAKEIAYLKQQEAPKKASLEVESKIESAIPQKRPFTNRLKVGIAGEIRPAKVDVEKDAVPDTQAVDSKETIAEVSSVTAQQGVEQSVEQKKVDSGVKVSVGVEVKPEKIATPKVQTEEEVREDKKTPLDQGDQTVRQNNAEQKARKDAVSKLYLVRLHTIEQYPDEIHKQLAGIVGPISLQIPTNNKERDNQTKAPETIASKSSWKDFLQTQELLTFVTSFVDEKAGFTGIVRRYAPSIHIDPRNPASLSTVSTMNVYKLIHGEEGVYGLDETKRKELSDIVNNLDIIIRAAKAQKTLEESLPGENFSSIIENETFESYYDRALREAEQVNLQEEKKRQKLDSFYKKAA